MGIYYSGKIFGIKMYNFNDDGLDNVLFEKTYDKIISDEEKKEVYLFYNQLNNKHQIRIAYYTECNSTYDSGTYLSWCPMSLILFLKEFDI